MEQTKKINGVHILGYADSYQMFGKNGNMERDVRVHLDRGVRVVYYGYAMNSTEMVICDDDMNAVVIYNGDNPALVSDYEINKDSWSPTYKRVDGCCRPLSQVYGIGTYYDESGVMISDEVIEKSIAHAKAVESAIAENKRKEEDAWDNAVAKAKSDYSHVLTPLDGIKDYREREKTQKKNLMALLKQAFPSVKFTGRKGYNSMSIKWTDGPSEGEVKAIASKFEDEYDGNPYDDYYHTTATPFTSVFGGWDSVYVEREYSDAFVERCKAEANKFKTDAEFRWHVQEVFKSNEYYEGNRDEWWRVIAKHTSDYKRPAKTQTKPADNSGSSTYNIVDYSEKAIAITGDTKIIKDVLKQLGGRFNAKLSCGAGWIFPKKREAEIKIALGL